MKKIIYLLWIAGFFPVVGYSQNKPAKRPNIIVILTDDLGYADLSIHGSVPDVKTPHIDQLAKTGIRFTNGYVTAPQCSPSRAAIISGKYQERYGMDEIPKGPLPLDEVTIANRLNEVGYMTGMVGKWHLEPSAITEDWALKAIPGIKPIRKTGNKNIYNIPEKYITPYMPYGRGFQQFFCGLGNSYHANYDLKGNLLNPAGVSLKEPGYRLDIQTQGALEFIKRNAETEKPFFLYLAYYGPHVPLQATPKYLDRFKGEMAERRRYALSMVSAIDDGVGKIMQTLKDKGIDQQTMVVFASDNGAPYGITKEDLPIENARGAWDGSLNDPFLGEKGMLTEGGIHVPFIINYPALPKGKIYEKSVSSLDIAATAVYLAGSKNTKGLDGVNLIPYLNGTNKNDPHEYLFWRFWQQSAVRSGKWKYLQGGTAGAFLFDLDKDPEEKFNLIKKEPQIASNLKKALYQWGKELAPPLIPEGPLEKEKKWYDYYLHLKDEK